MKKLSFHKRVTLLLFITTIIYVSFTALIALFLMPTQTIYMQLVMIVNLVITGLVMYPIVKKIMYDYTFNSPSILFFAVLPAAALKWVSNAISGEISVVYLLLIIIGFFFYYEEEK